MSHVPIIRRRRRPLKQLEFLPENLFTAGVDGAFFEIADTQTLFQDDAGAVQVSAAGQSVGLILDKSGNDNHASQTIELFRPKYQVSPARIVSDGIDDVIAWVAPSATYTVVRVNLSGTVTIQTGQPLLASISILLELNIVAYLAISRPLTIKETASLTAYFEALV